MTLQRNATAPYQMIDQFNQINVLVFEKQDLAATRRFVSSGTKKSAVLWLVGQRDYVVAENQSVYGRRRPP